MIRTNYTQPFGELYEPVPELDASSYDIFSLESRLFPIIQKRHPYAQPSFLLNPDGDQMRLFVEVNEFDFPAINEDQEAELQSILDKIMNLYPEHCVLNISDDVDHLAYQMSRIDSMYLPVIYNNMLMVNLAFTGKDYMEIFNELTDKIFNIETGRITYLSDLLF